MELTLDTNDIKKALTQYVAKQGFDLTNKHVDVALVNGRSGNGNRAVVNITDACAGLTTKDNTPNTDNLNLEGIEHVGEDTMPEMSQGEVEPGHVEDSGIDKDKAALPVEETIPLKGEEVIVPTLETEDEVGGLFENKKPTDHPKTETLF